MNSSSAYGLSSLPETRQAILKHLKVTGEARAESIAVATDITISGVRQHLVSLERDGLVMHHQVREGPGRPKHFYSLTAAGDTLFPRNYAALTNELLQYVDHEDPTLVQKIFNRRGQRRLEQARARTTGLPFEARLATLARILDEDGYLAEFRQLDDGTFLLIEHNCAVLIVAQRYTHACASELAFLQALLPEAQVARVAHQAVAGHVCAYEVRLKAS